jgi:transcription-repair coupling factor (superfamily II helicase)
LMSDDPFKQEEPPKFSGRPPKPGKPPLFKDRRAHRIELRNKISGFKEEINELKTFKTDDESKKDEIQQKMSLLKTRLKECEMEKESIEQFNHTQFVKNVEKSREDESRFDKESHGQTRFFENLTKGAESEDTPLDAGWNPTGDDNKEATDPLIEEAKPKEVSSTGSEVQSTESSMEEETSPKVETEVPLPQIEIPPNTIV